MEYKYPYKDLKERRVQITKAEGKGYQMLHDDFDDPNWKHGDPLIGTMTFTDVIEPSPIPEPVRDLAKEVDEIKAGLAAIKTKVGMK